MQAWIDATDQSGPLLTGPEKDVFNASATAFQLGGSVGFHAQLSKLTVGVDWHFMIRDLELAWAAAGVSKTIPSELPRKVGFGGVTRVLWIAAVLNDPFTG